MSLRPRGNSSGMTLVEVLLCSGVLGILISSGAAFGLRRAALGSDLAAYEQAVLTAQQVLEFRRARGRLPRDAEIEAARSAIGRNREPRVVAREVLFRGTGLAEVGVTVFWRKGSGPAEGKVHLVTLAPRPAGK